jgi:hypothetical protein
MVHLSGVRVNYQATQKKKKKPKGQEQEGIGGGVKKFPV